MDKLEKRIIIGGVISGITSILAGGFLDSNEQLPYLIDTGMEIIGKAGNICMGVSLSNYILRKEARGILKRVYGVD